MDTEAFLLERQQIQVRLAEHRATVEYVHSANAEQSFLGMDVRDWIGLVSGALPGSGLWRFLPKSFLTFAGPFLVGALRRKVSRPASWMGRVLGLWSSLRRLA